MARTHNPDLTHRIIDLAMQVHTHIGSGLVEQAYERCLCHLFDRNSLIYERQVAPPLTYEGMHLDCVYRADIIVETKSC